MLADSCIEVVTLTPGSKTDFSFVASVAVAHTAEISLVQHNRKSSSNFHLVPTEM